MLNFRFGLLLLKRLHGCFLIFPFVPFLPPSLSLLTIQARIYQKEAALSSAPCKQPPRLHRKKKKLSSYEFLVQNRLKCCEEMIKKE